MWHDIRYGLLNSSHGTKDEVTFKALLSVSYRANMSLSTCQDGRVV